LDYLFVPINRHQTHWCFVMVDLIQKNFVFYDSMSTKQTRTGLEILEMVKQYMVQESQSQDPSQNWKEFYDAYESIGGDECPQQENGFDCGVFVCKAVEVKSRGLDFNYTQKDMINLRRRMVYEMLQCKLLT
ncbi:cysteine proteinase, partial [Nadsonia fulvescens var. elongata DSM 6958]